MNLPWICFKLSCNSCRYFDYHRYMHFTRNSGFCTLPVRLYWTTRGPIRLKNVLLNTSIEGTTSFEFKTVYKMIVKKGIKRGVQFIFGESISSKKGQKAWILDVWKLFSNLGTQFSTWILFKCNVFHLKTIDLHAKLS